MEHWWNDTGSKTKLLRNKPLLMPFCPPQIPCGLAFA